MTFLVSLAASRSPAVQWPAMREWKMDSFRDISLAFMCSRIDEALDMSPILQNLQRVANDSEIKAFKNI